jgi:hypothetical protein
MLAAGIGDAANAFEPVGDDSGFATFLAADFQALCQLFPQWVLPAVGDPLFV